MSVKLCQHFDNFETWTPVGNATVSNVHKFGAASACFASNSDYFSVSNNSGLFNINSDSNRNFECFFKPAAITLNPEQIATLDNSIKFFNGHAYKLIPYDHIEWNWAKKRSEYLGGHLVIIPDQDTQNFIFNNFCINIDYDFWIGGFKQNNSWFWVNGQPISYFNWHDTPEFDREGYDFIEILHENNKGVWDVDPIEGNNNDGFIVEWDNLLDLSLYLYGYRFFNGHSFKLLHSQNISWHDAKSQCEALGGHLATSTSKDKNDFLTRIKDNHHIWLGGTDENNEGNWSWITAEEWSFSNWEDGQPNNADDNQHFLAMLDNSDLWNDCEIYQDVFYFVCEWDLDFRSTLFILGNIFNFDNMLSLALNHDATLSLLSDSANINASSTDTVTTDAWHHVSLRVHDGYAKVYLDGNLLISADCSNLNITPSKFSLGGFSGYIDEFAVSDDTDAPASVPTRHFETFRRVSSAPVKFALWSCSNLPDGLTLSENGLLSGTPTVTGTFNCNISLNTNWGTTNKILRIVIN